MQGRYLPDNPCSSNSLLRLMKSDYRKPIFFLLILALALTQASPFWGLLFGLTFSLLIGSPFPKELLSKYHGPLLKIAVVGLGFGLNINSVIATGREGAEVTLIMLLILAIVGFILAKVLQVNMRTALLITSGTAICGGSAIAAMSPIVSAKNNEISVAIGVVFILNAIALITFPMAGRWIGLNDAQFAWWAAMAIHDTSSVVGAASQFGDQSLVLATTVKLTRALWIIPISLMAAVILQPKQKKLAIPYFILFFIAAAVLASYLPIVQSIAPLLTQGSKILFTLVLFLIGMGLNKSIFQEMGVKPVLYGVTLWLITAVFSLVLIYGCCHFSRF